MRTPSQQRGVVLFIAMIVLVVMTLAGIAMMRQVTTGVLIAGNLAFKENATSVGDRGVEQARAFLVGSAADALVNNGATAGYYANWDTTFNALTYDWTAGTNSTLVTADDGFQNEIRYVIHRLCSAAGAATATPCVTVVSTGAGSTKGEVAYGEQPLPNSVQPYFRITVRVKGPRNSTSFVQTIMY